MLPWIDAASLRSALDYPSAVEALRQAYAGAFQVPPRSQVDLLDNGGRMWLMPAAAAGSLGVKLVTQFDSNAARGIDRIQGVYVYLDGETGQPLALLDGRAITEIRTAAVSALATRLLANPTPDRGITLGVFGHGVQGRAHIAAMRACFNIRETRICESDPSKSTATAAECAAADLICVCTTSRTPVIDGNLLRPGTHINAIGNSRPDGRELDTATVARSRLAVDSREGVMAEAGDLLMPMAEGAIDASHILADLPELARGEKIVRQSPADITLFKAVGFALGDLALARLAYQKWSAR